MPARSDILTPGVASHGSTLCSILIINFADSCVYHTVPQKRFLIYAMHHKTKFDLGVPLQRDCECLIIGTHCFNPIWLQQYTIKLTCENFISKDGRDFQKVPKIWSGYAHAGSLTRNWNTQSESQTQFSGDKKLFHSRSTLKRIFFFLQNALYYPKLLYPSMFFIAINFQSHYQRYTDPSIGHFVSKF